MLNAFHRRLAIFIAALVVISTSAAEPPTDIRRDATVIAVEATMPSVVNISAKTVVQRRGYLYDWWRDNWAPFYQELPPQMSAGSGVIIDEDGYVLTNVHVVGSVPAGSVTRTDAGTAAPLNRVAK